MIQPVVGFAAIGTADLISDLACREGWPKPRPGGPNATDAAAVITADLERPAGFLQLIQRWTLGRARQQHLFFRKKGSFADAHARNAHVQRFRTNASRADTEREPSLRRVGSEAAAPQGKKDRRLDK
jgi:hypothetical protein